MSKVHQARFISERHPIKGVSWCPQKNLWRVYTDRVNGGKQTIIARFTNVNDAISCRQRWERNNKATPIGVKNNESGE